MSVTTDAVLLLPGWCDEREAVRALNADLARTEARQQFEKLDEDAAGGYKVLNVDIYACAFNYTEPMTIFEAVAAAPWSEPAEVMLYVRSLDWEFAPVCRTVVELRGTGLAA